VDRGALGARRHHHEVAIPGRELLERSEHLLALGAALRAAEPLIGVALRQVEALELLLGGGARLDAALGGRFENPRRGFRRVEVRVAVDVARELEQRVASLRRRGVE
jgi:hypothetical protein